MNRNLEPGTHEPNPEPGTLESGTATMTMTDLAEARSAKAGGRQKLRQLACLM
jgi:hypothetical protein